MKKLFLSLMVILSCCFVRNVDASEMYLQPVQKITEYSFNRMISRNNQYYFYYHDGSGYKYYFTSMKKDFTGRKLIINGNHNNELFFDNYYFLTSYNDIIKYDINNNEIKNYNNGGTYSYDPGYALAVGENILFYNVVADRNSTTYKFTLLDHDLNVINDIETSGNYFSFDSNNNKIYAFNNSKLVIFNDKLEEIANYTFDYNEVGNYYFEDLYVFGDDEIFITYQDLSYDRTVEFYVYKFDSKAKLNWKKNFKSPVYNVDRKVSSLIKLKNGNYLFGNGALFEFDKSGNIVNSCPDCTDAFGLVEDGDKILTLGFDYYDIFTSKDMLLDNSLVSELKFREKAELEIKDSANGRVRINKTNPYAGEEVVVTLRPQVNYVLDELIIKDKSGKRVEYKKINDKKYSFVLPVGKTSIEVTYKKK